MVIRRFILKVVVVDYDIEIAIFEEAAPDDEGRRRHRLSKDPQDIC